MLELQFLYYQPYGHVIMGLGQEESTLIDSGFDSMVGLLLPLDLNSVFGSSDVPLQDNWENLEEQNDYHFGLEDVLL